MPLSRRNAIQIAASFPMFLSSAWAQQTAQTLEKRIANLPPAQQAYERFRYWVTMLPADQQKQGDTPARYREHLKQGGMSDAEADAQIKLVMEQGSRSEVERWNRILTDAKPMFNVKPNEFLVEMAKGRKPGTALDVGMGQGRNAIWLAQQGWDVTGFDPADKAVALAVENARKLGVHLKTEIKTMEEFDFGDSRWELILLCYVGARQMTAAIQRALRPGGVLVIEGSHRDATKGRSIGGAVVFDTGELPALYPQLRVVRYEEPMAIADFGQQKTRVVRYCGERPV
jgi:SAM-dependent methyltransferase